MKEQFVKTFAIFSTGLLLLLGGVVVFVDPFFHYHAPIGGLKAVISNGEYQCVGTVEHFEYDSILLGSSVVENYNNRWFEEAFGGTMIKGVQRSAETVDLLYYLNKAMESHDIKNVYYNLDNTALSADPKKDYPTEAMPLYIHNDNILDDVQYIWNKDVIFEHIPYMLAMSFVGNYEEEESYNWAQYKTFSKEVTLSNYQRLETVSPMLEEAAYKESIDANLAAIENVVKEHPEITFRFICPPYSMLWWDNAYQAGELEQRLYASEAAAECLLPYENVEMYYFQNHEEIITNLDHYMDAIHFSQEINRCIVDWMKEGKYQLTLDNYKEEIGKMRQLSDKIQSEYIGLYY